MLFSVGLLSWAERLAGTSSKAGGREVGLHPAPAWQNCCLSDCLLLSFEGRHGLYTSLLQPIDPIADWPARSRSQNAFPSPSSLPHALPRPPAKSEYCDFAFQRLSSSPEGYYDAYHPSNSINKFLLCLKSWAKYNATDIMMHTPIHRYF